MAEEVVEGRIVFGEDSVPFEGASVEVTIEDTTYADAPAVRLARLVLRAVTHDGRAGGSIPFSLRRDASAPHRRQSLRVVVDVDGDGRLGVGDYRNAESVPVPPGPVTGLVVRMRRLS